MLISRDSRQKCSEIEISREKCSEVGVPSEKFSEVEISRENSRESRDFSRKVKRKLRFQ